MPELTCFRLLNIETPAGPLAESVRQVNAGQESTSVFAIDSGSFAQVPNAPFAYWVDEKIRILFKELSAFESAGRTARVGLQTGDDFRFVRCWWEVSDAKRWHPLAKGGGVSPYYADIFLKINWAADGRELREFGGSVIRNDTFYGKAGAFQTLRSLRLAPHLTPRGCIFSHNGFQFFSPENDLLLLLGLTNSSFFESLYRLNVGADERPLFVAGVMQLVPVPVVSSQLKLEIENLAKACWLNRRRLAVRSERSPWFSRPAVKATSLTEASAWVSKLESELEIEFVEKQTRIEKLALQAYGDVPPISGGHSARSRPANAADEEAEEAGSSDLVRSAISFAVGMSFGRWIADAATPDQALPDDPLTSLPAVPPGFARDGHRPYLVDDAQSISGFAESVRHNLIKEFGDDVESSLSLQLQVATLRDYLIKPTGFFADHLGVYSKSRRQAPIYWPLSTKSGNFTIWVYYPKLDDQSLPKLIADVLSPKIRTLSQEIENRRASPGGKVAELEALRLELEEMRTDFLDLINRGYRPNQNDGVLITACPLAKYFRHAGFRSKLEACWLDLARGDFDWAHLAMSMWPDRVVEVCKKDRSIAIAHGKEELCPAEPPKSTRGRKKTAPSA